MPRPGSSMNPFKNRCVLAKLRPSLSEIVFNRADIQPPRKETAIPRLPGFLGQQWMMTKLVLKFVTSAVIALLRSAGRELLPLNGCHYGKGLRLLKFTLRILNRDSHSKYPVYSSENAERKLLPVYGHHLRKWRPSTYSHSNTHS
jgi:hypothetical protein